jgi:ABC-type transporter Mla subunit MlaD
VPANHGRRAARTGRPKSAGAEPPEGAPSTEAAAPVASAIADEVHTVLAAAREAAGRIRAEADAYAEQVRTEARREADDALQRVLQTAAAADAEAERTLREAALQSRQRLEALEAEVERAERRLKDLLTVFRGVTAQLEHVLESTAPLRDEARDAESRR